MNESPNINPLESRLADTLKSEHLNEGISPIIACLGTPEEFDAGDSGLNDESRRKGEHIHVDWLSNMRDSRLKEMKSQGERTYVISPTDSADKFSGGYMDCTGLVVTGLDKETGENISFLTHQNDDFLHKNSKNMEDFIHDIDTSMKGLKEKCVEGTIDAVIVGGNVYEVHGELHGTYYRMIRLVSDEVRKELGFEPVVVTGPKKDLDYDDVFYDNKNRRLFIERAEGKYGKTKMEDEPRFLNSYLPRNIQSEKEKWAE